MKFLELLQIFLLGIIEGITEWLPVSSTGHMVLFNNFYPSTLSDEFMSMFEYVIQLAAILAIVILFWNKIFPFGTNKTQENKLKIYWKKDVWSLWLKVIVACIPAICAIAVDVVFENMDEYVQTIIIASTLILYGVAFILIEKYNKKEASITELAQISYKYAFFIGCFQLLAAIPGTSRSGITIIGALLLGLSRPAAAEFTFILAIPTMVGSSAYKLLKFFLESGTMTGVELGYLAIGSIVAFGVSFFCVKLLMSFVRKHDFKVFGWYRIALGAVVLAALVIPPMF